MSTHRKLSVRQEHELLEKLENARLTNKYAQSVIESPGNQLGKKIVTLLEAEAGELTEGVAAEIMGENFIGTEDVMKHLNVSYSKNTLRALHIIPTSRADLESCRHSHILIPGYPLSIQALKAGPLGELLFDRRGDWWANEPFGKHVMTIQWRLIRLRGVTKSEIRFNFDEKLKLLEHDEEVPLAITIAYMRTLYYCVRGEWPFNWAVECIDDATHGGGRTGSYSPAHVTVEPGERGIKFDWSHIDNSDDRLAAERRLGEAIAIK